MFQQIHDLKILQIRRSALDNGNLANLKIEEIFNINFTDILNQKPKNTYHPSASAPAESPKNI